MMEEFKKIVAVLSSGGIILYPTDTIWGIGCDATNDKAVKRIYDIKKREDNKSMLVLLDNENRLTQYIGKVPDIAWELIEASDKPLTLIYPYAKNLAPNLIANDGSVGIRIVKDEFCVQLIKQFRKPLVSTSANISGEKSPVVFSEISENIKSKVDYIVTHRQSDNTPGIPSSIIKINDGGFFKIIRE